MKIGESYKSYGQAFMKFEKKFKYWLEDSVFMYTCLKIYLYKLKIRLYKFSSKFIGY